DPHTMRATVAMAIEQGVAVGAHPGYDDREGFGRRPMHLSAADVNDLILYQLGALDAVARAAGAILRHVKPHGALYNQAAAAGSRSRLKPCACMATRRAPRNWRLASVGSSACLA